MLCRAHSCCIGLVNPRVLQSAFCILQSAVNPALKKARLVHRCGSTIGESAVSGNELRYDLHWLELGAVLGGCETVCSPAAAAPISEPFCWALNRATWLIIRVRTRMFRIRKVQVEGKRAPESQATGAGSVGGMEDGAGGRHKCQAAR